MNRSDSGADSIVWMREDLIDVFMRLFMVIISPEVCLLWDFSLLRGMDYAE